MHKGHLDQTQSNVRSTKQNRQRSHDLFVGIIEDMATDTTLHRQGTIYSDPTGKFIISSSQGNNYILVVFDGDSNYIFAEPIPSRSSEQILRAYTKIHDLLTSRGIDPKMHICDNEASTLLKRFLSSKGVSYQLVPQTNIEQMQLNELLRLSKIILLLHCVVLTPIFQCTYGIVLLIMQL